jgi:hypothetical protein
MRGLRLREIKVEVVGLLVCLTWKHVPFQRFLCLHIHPCCHVSCVYRQRDLQPGKMCRIHDERLRISPKWLLQRTCRIELQSVWVKAAEFLPWALFCWWVVGTPLPRRMTGSKWQPWQTLFECFLCAVLCFTCVQLFTSKPSEYVVPMYHFTHFTREEARAHRPRVLPRVVQLTCCRTWRTCSWKWVELRVKALLLVWALPLLGNLGWASVPLRVSVPIRQMGRMLHLNLKA